MNKKIKLLYAVVACFTLGIMTMGATYAYWTASTASMENDVSTSSVTYSISMEIKPLPLYTDFSLIPMNDADAIKALKNECKDKYGRGACSAYSIRVFGYSENLNFISGYIDIITDNMENISYMVLEEQDNSQEDSCVIIDEKNYCISKEATSMGDGSKLSIGDSYDVSGVSEKNLLLVFWLSNLNINQNSIDVGTYNATVTILAGNGGEIKGTIANAVQINQGDSQEPSTDNTDTP